MNLIDSAWNQVTSCTMNLGWRKLWPDCVPERNFKGFEETVDNIVSMGRSMGLEVDNNIELTTEELVTLPKEQEKTLAESIIFGRGG